MIVSVAVSWVEAPLKRFVDDARTQLAVLLLPSGQVLGQFGFTRSVDVMTACALSAAIHASASELGRMVDGTPFTGLHYAGTERQLFLGDVPISGGNLVLLAVFDDESSIGLVHVFFKEFCTAARKAAPAPEAPLQVLSDDFERELNHNLAVLFGRQ